jgi:hypothetical protein
MAATHMMATYGNEPINFQEGRWDRRTRFKTSFLVTLSDSEGSQVLKKRDSSLRSE